MICVECIMMFDVLLYKYGCGFGCDVCKLVVVGIFVLCFNEFVLKKEYVGL